MITKRFICVALNASLCVSTLALFGCNNPSPQPAGPASGTSAPSPNGSAPTAQNAPPPYTPPTADQLYQLVAPIALFPDNLVAQVLAGATYPDQISAADTLLAQNPNLKGPLLQTAVNPQPWDASVKGLTAFPSVLDQMAKNIQWTTALGTAYVNDPTDVMNAIQVMRQRASKHGALRSTAQQRVTTQAVTETTAYPAQPDSGYPPVYSGPAVVPAPEQAIEIMPAQPDVVYVPSYNPQTVYGEELPYYPGYAYASPGYSTGDVVVAGAIGFGAGILIANLFDHHDDHSWGWNSWGMHWGHGGYGGGNGGYGGGWQGPAVVHNNNVYVSRSNTVINQYTTNNVVNNRYINNGQINSNNRTVQNNVQNNSVNNINNINNHNADVRNNFHPPANGIAAPAQAQAAALPRGAMPMTTPNFHNAMQSNPHALAAPAQAPAARNIEPNVAARMAAANPAQARAMAATHPGQPANPGNPAAPRFNPPAQNPAHEVPRAMPPRENPMVQHAPAAPPAQARQVQVQPQRPAPVRQEIRPPAAQPPHPQEFNRPEPPRPAEANRPAPPRPQEFNRQPPPAPHPAAAEHHEAPPHKEAPHPDKDDHHQ